MEYKSLLAYLSRNGFVGDGFIYKKRIDNVTLTCRIAEYEVIFGVMYNELYYAVLSKDIEEIPNLQALKLIYDKVLDELFKDMTTKLKQNIKFL